MAAFLLQTIGGAPERAAPVRFDVRARSREFLRRGLLLSGALHIALVYAFLHLPAGGDEILVRSYGHRVDIFQEPVTPTLIPLPPAPPGPDAPSKQGIIVPVDPGTLRLPPLDFRGLGEAGVPTASGSTTASGPATGSDGPPAETFDPNQVFSIKTVDVPPVETYAPKPAYPDIAKDAWITGRVVAQVLVQADGSVARVRIVSGNKLLADSVQETLYRWRFRPATVRGRPVAVWVEIPVNFTL